MIGYFHRSNLVTYLGVIIAVVGITLAGQSAVAVCCLIIAGVCDLFDGVFARRFQRSAQVRQFGIQLDSLADMVSFTALPLAVLMAMSVPAWLGACIGAIYALAAVTRLAYFNVHADADGPVKAYRGVPVTYAALVLPVLYLLGFGIQILGWWASATSYLWLIGMAGLAIGYVWDVQVPKPRGKAYIGFSLLAVILLGLSIWAEVG